MDSMCTQVADQSSSKLAEMFTCNVQRREDIGLKWENMKVSSLMRTYEIMDLKRQLESFKGKEKIQLNKHTLAEYYKKIKFCKSSEPVKVGFVEVAQMLHSSALHIPLVQQVLFQFDELPANPLDGVYKVREVVIQCEKKSRTCAGSSQCCLTIGSTPTGATKSRYVFCRKMALWEHPSSASF